MHIESSDLAAFGGSTTFTFRRVRPTQPVDIDVASRRHDPAPAAGSGAPAPGTAEDTAPSTGGPLDLVRGVVEQIVGQGLRAAEIDAIADAVQPVSLAFDRARQADAAARRAASRERITWGATLDLREARTGEGTFAASGTLVAADGHEVEIDVRLTGDGDATVVPQRLDVDVGGDGRVTRMAFSGRAVADDAGAAAAWAGLPVRVNRTDGATAVTTLGHARAATLGPEAGAGGGHHIDMVA